MPRVALLAGLLLFMAFGASAEEITHGPFVGHVGTSTALIWARFDAPGTYSLEVHDDDGTIRTIDLNRESLAANDYTVVFSAVGLESDHEYGYVIKSGPKALTGDDCRLKTAPATSRSKVKLAFGSCASHKVFPEQQAWDRIDTVGAEIMILLGDTPYIDSTDLAVQRRCYREFYSLPEIAKLLRHTPFYGTWDDHDFGVNDTDGRVEGKEFSRQAFLEYHGNPYYGLDDMGVYTGFRRGPVEVFLLDTRWFAATEPSPFDESKPSLLGKVQWQWLKSGLSNSRAPFKILACGMIWNGSVRPGKKDHWMTYPHEREALFRFLGEEKISGVVLVGGDIHRSRALRYPATMGAGYELTELITSPLASNIIEAANAPHPHLLHDVAEQETFLLVSVDGTSRPAKLVAQCLAADGRELFRVELDSSDLRAKK